MAVKTQDDNGHGRGRQPCEAVGIHSSEVDYLNCRLFCISQRQFAPHKLPDRSYIAIQTSFCDSIG